LKLLAKLLTWSQCLREQFSDIEWRQIIGLRHILVHEYFGIDAQLIWQVIIDDLPVLKTKVQEILEQLP